jgi:hypothetical protein
VATGPIPLHDLPLAAAQIAGAVVRASHGLAAAAIDHARDPRALSPGQLLVRETAVEWRMSMSKKEGRVLLFFFRREGEPQPQVQAVVRLHIEASDDDDGDEAATQPLPVSLRMVGPGFLSLSPSALDVARWAPGGRKENTTLFLLGNGASAVDRVLAVIVDDDPDDARVVFTTPEGTRELTAHDGRWPVVPFDAAIDALAGWIRAGSPDEREETSLALAEQPRNHLTGVVRAVLDAYASTRAALGGRTSLPVAVPPWPRTKYAVASYSAALVLWLDADGNLADDPDEATLPLSHHLKVRETASTMVGNVALGPADLVADGDLLREVTRAMAEAVEGRVDALFGEPRPSPEELRAFLANASSLSLRLRRKKDRERHLVVWRGHVRERAHVLLVGGWLVVEGSDAGGWTCSLFDDVDLEVHAFGPADDRLVGFPDEAVRYLASFTRSLKAWKELVI